MRKVENAEDFVVVAARQGVTISEIEAQVLVESFHMGSYGLCRDDCFNLSAYPFDEEDFNGYEDRSIEEVCLEAIEIIEELMVDAVADGNGAIEDLRKNLYILHVAEEKIKQVVPPTVREYQVLIVENLKKLVTVGAASIAEAISVAKENYENGDYLMDEPGNYAGAYFNVVSC